MKITTKEATVKTASVEMRVLSISGKQMTLAVYRQLDSEAIIAEDSGTLRGIPWGRVNYFWGDCSPNHLHIVWQKGEELRRSCVRQSFGIRYTLAFGRLEDTIERLCQQRIAEGWEPKLNPYEVGSFSVEAGGYTIGIERSELINKALGRGDFRPYPDGYFKWTIEQREKWQKEARETQRREAQAELKRVSGKAIIWETDVKPILKELEEIEKCRQASWAALNALDLLLIAV